VCVDIEVGIFHHDPYELRYIIMPGRRTYVTTLKFQWLVVSMLSCALSFWKRSFMKHSDKVFMKEVNAND